MNLVPAPPQAVDQRVHPTAEDVAAAFLLGYSGHTRSAYAADLRTWFLFCETYNIGVLSARRPHIDAWARSLDEVDGFAPTTVARKLSAVAGFYKYAADEEVIGKNVAAAVRRPKVGNDTTSTGLSKEELTKLISVANRDSPRSLVVVLLLALNGLRVSEALEANVEDLTEERGHRVLKVVRKGGKSAVIPLAPRTSDAVKRYLAGRTGGPLIVSRNGLRWDRARVWRVVRRLAEEAGIERPIHPHDLRHAFVSLSLDAGASLRDVQDAAGHADPRTTRRYDRARYNLDKHPTYALAGMV